MVRPRAENYEERKAEILDAAAAIFAERGFDGTSISSIASRCGISKALLYHYYDSKEELLYRILQSHCSLLVETASTAASLGNDPKSKLLSLARALMDLYVESRNKHVVLLNNLHTLPDDRQDEIKSLERQVVSIIKDILASLRPDLSNAERSSLSMYFMGSINWTYTWFKEDGAISAREYADLAAKTFLEGIYSNSPNSIS